jgi:hypothetical protein
VTRVSDNPTEQHNETVDLSGYGFPAFIQRNASLRYKPSRVLFYCRNETEVNCYSVKVTALNIMNIFTTAHKLYGILQRVLKYVRLKTKKIGYTFLVACMRKVG